MATSRYGILVGWDGSEHGTRALEWGIEEARLRRTQLTICHFWQFPYSGLVVQAVVGFEQMAEHALRMVVTRARAAAPGLEIHPLLVCGSAARNLIDLGSQADLVIVGTHGMSGVRERMLGSVTSQVAMHCESPVIVVRGQSDPLPSEAQGQIVAGVDGSPAADAALAMAFEEAELRELPLTAVCAWNRPDRDSARAVYAEDGGLHTFTGEHFHETVERMNEAHPGVKVTAELADATVLDALPAAAAAASLLVVGARGVGAVRGRLLGSVSQTMLHRSRCPVAVVHAPEHPSV